MKVRIQIRPRVSRLRDVSIFTILLFIPVGIISPTASGAQVNFSGEIKPEVILNIPGSGGYDDTPLNPDNQLGIDDVMFRSEINLKLDAQGESSALDLWFQVKQFPIADLFIGSAAIAEAIGGLVGYKAAVADLFFVADPYIFTLDIMRAAASWMPADSVRITLGRQSFLTGYGYGWNPVDLANPPKDPTDPQAYLRGVDALDIRLTPAAWMNTRLYGALPSKEFAWGYDEILAGGEITFYAPMMEFKIAGLYGGAESNDDAYDFYPHAGATAFYIDVLGLGVYGEGVLRSRSRRNVPDTSDNTTDIKEGPVFSGLAGMEYYFSSGLVLATEYFYNGEGWDRSEREDYDTTLTALGGSSGITGEYYALYTPTYFAQHYLLMNLLIPWYAIDSMFNLNVIWSPESAAIIFTPNAMFNLNYEGTLTSEIWYSGMFSYDDAEKNESWLAPVNHSLWFNLRYYF